MRRTEQQQIEKKQHLSFPRWFSQGNDKINKQKQYVKMAILFFIREEKVFLIEKIP